MRGGSGWIAALALALTLGAPARAGAFDPADEFARGTLVVSVQGGGGAQNNLEGHRVISDISFVNAGHRVTLVPWDPVGSGALRGAVELGLEGWFQYYLEPSSATAEGLKVLGRYNFLGLGRLVPYLEATAGAGGTSLNVKEVNSNFTFVLEAGAGLSYFLSRGVALSAGYRFQHISNGNVSSPNRGFNSDTGVAGVSFFFH